MSERNTTDAAKPRRQHDHHCPGCGVPIDCDYICCPTCTPALPPSHPRAGEDKAFADGYEHGLAHRAEELAANKRLLDAATARLAEVEAERDASVEAVHIHAADMVRRAMQALPDDVALGMADPGCDADLERQASEALDAGCGAGDVARATAKSRKARAQTARETVAKALTKCFAADKVFRQDALARVRQEAVREAVERMADALDHLSMRAVEHDSTAFGLPSMVERNTGRAEGVRESVATIRVRLATLLPNDPEAWDV